MLTLRALPRGRIPLSGGDSETSRATSRSYRLPPPRPRRSGSLRKKSMPHVPGFLFLHQRPHNFAGPQSWGSGPPQLHEKEAHPEEIQGSWWRRSWSFPTISQLPSARVLRRRPYRTRRCQLGADKSQSILLQPFFLRYLISDSLQCFGLIPRFAYKRNLVV